MWWELAQLRMSVQFWIVVVSWVSLTPFMPEMPMCE